MPLQSTSGAASYDAFGGGVAAVPKYIEDYFSTFLYQGTGSSQTINNEIDLSTKGGLVWFKSRSGAYNHALIDTARGGGQVLSSNTTSAQADYSPQGISAFNTNGFTFGTTTAELNNSSNTYTSWSWAKAPKFFDVVTYTGDGTSPRAISHSLGSAPGCVIIKQTNAVNDWCVWHTATGNDKSAALNLTDAFATFAQRIKSVTSTTFTVGNSSTVNDSGATYVAYLFAHNAGGFGLTGTDNVISCGSFTGSASGTTVNLGWEPQWVLIKRSSGNTDNWRIYDNMRGMTASNGGQLLYADTSGSETTNSRISVNATGFGFVDDAAYGNIYIAIRRGPMKVPTSGTSVFAVSTASGEPAYSPLFTAGFSDMTLHSPRVSESGNGHLITDRLRGNGVILETPYTNADNTISTYFKYDSNDGAYIPNLGYFNNTGGTSKPYALRAFRRAPSFFDVVCYTGTGSATTVTHNLGAVPEMMIVKTRSDNANWAIYTASLGPTKSINFTTASAGTYSVVWNDTAPTSSVFTVGTAGTTNNSGSTYVAYLFATCAGVSKCGTFTGNGSSQTINCGFTGGARFVMIKATSTTGDWMVADSARGIVSGSDPYLELNNTNAEVTGEDWLDTDSTGFVVNEVSGSNANTNGVTYIFLAIA